MRLPSRHSALKPGNDWQAKRLRTSAAIRALARPLVELISDQRGMWGLPAMMGIDPGGSYIKRIQTVTITLNGTTSNTATIVAVNTSNTVIFWQGENSTATSTQYDALARVTLTNSTTVTAYVDTSASSVTVKCTVVEFSSVALVSAVQYGSITIAASSTSNTATISSVTTSQAVVLFLGFTSSNVAIPDAYPNLTLTNSTTVTATRQGTNDTTTVNFVVCEFSTRLVKSVQHMSHTSTASGASFTDTISSVSTDNTILLYQGIKTAGTTPSVVFFTLELTNSTTVTLTKQTTNTSTRTIKYIVLEFQPGILARAIQRGTISLTTSQGSQTATIVAISTTRGIANFCNARQSSTSVEPDKSYFHLSLTNKTTITAQRSSASSALAAAVSYEAIEFR